MATLWFDFFLVRPYLSMEIESADDIEAALLLLGVGLLVGQVASRGRRSRRGRSRTACRSHPSSSSR
jgi:K+-sensing histidine kinase KdpD